MTMASRAMRNARQGDIRCFEGDSSSQCRHANVWTQAFHVRTTPPTPRLTAPLDLAAAPTHACYVPISLSVCFYDSGLSDSNRTPVLLERLSLMVVVVIVVTITHWCGARDGCRHCMWSPLRHFLDIKADEHNRRAKSTHSGIRSIVGSPSCSPASRPPNLDTLSTNRATSITTTLSFSRTPSPQPPCEASTAISSQSPAPSEPATKRKYEPCL